MSKFCLLYLFLILVKPFQNKKGHKNLRYPTKSSPPFHAFLLGTSNFFGPSYFEAALGLTIFEQNYLGKVPNRE